MKIYGVAILAACFLVGQLVGDFLGRSFHLAGNLGGVGFAMLLLIILHDRFSRQDIISHETESGIQFWGRIYIPVVVAMSATQNVKAALSGGGVALLAGILGTTACFLLVPVFARFTQRSNGETYE
jgi:malonate transporter MadL subunit